jgi:phenylacetate-CoA ligase
MLLRLFSTAVWIEKGGLDKNKELRSKIVNSEVVPSLFQYNPLLRYIESVNNELVFTVASQTPLVRFNLHDNGKILKIEEIKNGMGREFKKIEKEAGGSKIWNLPIVSLFGRSDHTLKFYAANIYPEHIRIALDHKPFLEKITGKFAMQKKTKEDLEQYLEINIELKAGVTPDDNFAEDIKKMIYAKLQEINKEFLCICKEYDKDLRPIIQLWENGHEKYFKPGLKPRFIIK